VFVPAMFMVMDDLASLIWRFGKKMIVSSGDGEHDDHHATPGAHGQPPAVRPAAE
jgi:hypothetical protein